MIAVLDIGGVADLAHLAVTDDIDTGLDLARDHLVHRIAHAGVKSGLVVAIVIFFLQEKFRYAAGPRQTTNMGGQNSVTAEFHDLSMIMVR